MSLVIGFAKKMRAVGLYLQCEDHVRGCKIEPSSSSFGREKLHGGIVLQECTAPVIGLTWIDLASGNLNIW